MNDPVWRALVYVVMKDCAGGRPLIDSPKKMLVSGPCPHCLHRIDPSEFAYREREARRGKKEEEIGVVVCGGCSEPLTFREAGKFQPMTRKIKRQLHKTTRDFIAKNQELILSIKRQIN